MRLHAFVIVGLTACTLPRTSRAQQNLALGAAAAKAGSPPKTAIAVEASTPPVVDGRGNDEAWQRATPITDFVQYFPKPDDAPRFKTEVRFVYDSKNLYVLARNFDPAPDSIMARLGRRDVDYPADWFGITLDGYHDRHTGQEFRVSAGGGFFDAQRIADGQPGLRPSWDGIWDAKVTIDSAGWTAEMRIPFSQIRFNGSENPVFGLLVRRNVGRDDSEQAWPRIDYKRAYVSWISQGGDLTGVTRVGRVSRLELIPFTVTKNVAQLRGNEYAHPTLQTFGSDVRYRLTPNVLLNATINPDFGQVEADPATLNLSAYELFFAERRPFFLEGSAIFNFQSWCDNVLNQGCDTAPLYTRRIGRAPQLAGRYGDAASPMSARILGATKISGRLSGGTSFGVMQATTAREVGTLGRTIEPMTNFLVLRAIRDLGGLGNGEFGGLLTVVSREMDEWTTPFLRRQAIVGGASLRRRLGGNLQLDAAFLTSMINGSRAAVTALQKDGIHRFQRIGSGLSVDTTRTSLSGYSSRLVLAKVGGANLWELSYQSLSPGFEMNDLGYQRRADMQSATIWAEHATRNGKGWFRERFLGTALRQSWTMRGMPTGRGESPWPSFFHVYGVHRLQNTGQFNVFLRAVLPNHPLDDFISRGGPALRFDPAYQFYSYYRTDSRKHVTGEVQLSLWHYEAGHAGTEWVSLGSTFRPTDRLQVSGAVIAYNWREDQAWYANRGVAGLDSTHYTFARLKVVEVNPTFRVDWTITPHFTLQWYAQPYLTGGTYSNWRELDDPMAEEYADRMKPFSGSNAPGSYNQANLRSNAVLRWEFSPGSIMYLVWQQRRDRYENTANVGSVSDAYSRMFATRPDNMLVLKVSFWINP